jgi:hypothetical protein
MRRLPPFTSTPPCLTGGDGDITAIHAHHQRVPLPDPAPMGATLLRAARGGNERRLVKALLADPGPRRRDPGQAPATRTGEQGQPPPAVQMRPPPREASRCGRTSPSSSAPPDASYGPTTTGTRDLRRGGETTLIYVLARMGASFASSVGA